MAVFGGRELNQDADLTSRQIAALLSARTTLWTMLDLSAVMQAAIESAVGVTGLDTGAIYLLNDNMLYLGATTPPLPPGFPDAMRHADACDHPHVMSAIDTGAPASYFDLQQERLTDAERGVVEARDLRTILYVPLFAHERPVGVFMVGTVGRTVELPRSAISVSRTLAYSIAQALDNARLFDSIVRRSDSMGEELRRELQHLSDEGSDAEARKRQELASEIHDRIDQRLTILKIRQELLNDELSSARGTDEAARAGLEAELEESRRVLALAFDESSAFARSPASSDVLRLGLWPALHHLARHSGTPLSDEAVIVPPDLQKADADTILFLYRAARSVVNVIADTPRSDLESIVVLFSETSGLTLRVSACGPGLFTSLDAAGEHSDAALRDLSLRVRRAGGELACAPRGDECVELSVSIPHLRIVT